MNRALLTSFIVDSKSQSGAAMLDIIEAAQSYLEARDELTAREDAHRELVDAYELRAGDLDAAEKALTAAEEREALALARLRAKVAAW